MEIPSREATTPPEPKVAEPTAPSEASPPEAREQSKVDHGALMEERAKRKEIEERLRKSEETQARMEERWKMLQEGRLQPQPQPQPRPAPKPMPRAEDDIFGAITHMQQMLERQGKEIDEGRRRQAEEARINELTAGAARAEVDFRQKTPDYDNALTFLRQNRYGELALWGMKEDDIVRQISHEERQILQRATIDKRSPAEMAYALAKQRGYKNGQPVPEVAPEEKPEEQMERVERGQRQNTSMAGVGGSGPPTSDISITDLLRMPEKEFLAFRDKYPARYRRLKGAER